MKLKISDMMDYVENIPVDIREKDIASIERIKEATMKKIQDTKTSPYTRTARKFSKAVIVAAVMAATLCVTVAAAAVIKWGGFAFTDGMSDADKQAFIENASVLHAGEYEDGNGYTHYLDENGNEIMVLSPKEAATYERNKQATKVQAVRESTDLVDVSTMPLMPIKVTELPVGNDGQFAECALGNGSLILLHPAEKNGFDLKAGDVITIALTSNDKCILEFGQFRDGDFVDATTASAQQHTRTFEIKEDGLYCFYVQYYSAGVSTFTDCMITVH